MKPTVEQYLFKPTSVLTQYDMKESKREVKRGNANVYRLGLLFERAEEIKARVKPHLGHNDMEGLFVLAAELEAGFTLKCADKLIEEIRATR